ncbi:MAG TPA: Hpt domain-containing protein [Thermodesulfobacteriota bacterium]|jgi:HPt (histidine-containing phosphotransfer) domain-containing protein|nr:Hpt domain-containing protein [Thermodesulfobacteriota bacterium]
MYEKGVVVYVDSELEDLIPIFLENRHKDVEEIRRLLKEGNLGEIRRLGHSMKGSGGGYGFDEISEIGRNIEEAAKSGDAERIERLNNQLAEYLSVVEVVVRDEE